MSGKMRVSILMVVIGALAGITLLALWATGLERASGEVNDEMRVDAEPTVAGVQSSISVPAGSTFSVLIHITSENHGGYAGYQLKLAYEETVINALPDDGVDNDAGTEPLENICAGTVCFPAGPVISNVADPLGQGTVFAGEARFSGTSPFVGEVYIVTFQCLPGVLGASPLDLRPPPVDPLGQNTSLFPSSSHPTDTFDAVVICGETPTPVPPTATPTITPTRTPVPPTVTNTPTVRPTIPPTVTFTPTVTNTPTVRPTIPPTVTFTPTPTNTPTVRPTIPPTVTFTPTPTNTPTVPPTLTSTPTATPTPAITPAPVKGRMTGGGSVLGRSRVTHGFELHCDAGKLPNNLQVNWGRGSRFHLESLTSASCSDNPAIDPRPPAAGFDTYVGRGVGRYNGVPGATAKWTFTDAGEPGKDDFARIEIWDADGDLVLSVSGNLKGGNHQAHSE